MKKRKLKPRKTIFIYYEGDTEACYFDELKSFVCDNINIIEKIDTLPAFNKNKLKTIKNKLYKNTGYTKNIFRNTNSQIFIIIDLDIYSQNDIDIIKKHIEDDYIKIIISNYNFELWILLHFIKYTSTTDEYIKEIKTVSGSDYRKGRSINNSKFFRNIIENNINTAIKNAEFLEKHNKSNTLKNKLPYTEVYKIIKMLKFK